MFGSQTETHGNWQYRGSGRDRWKRRIGTTEWEKADSPPLVESPLLELQLVREQQATGEPYHWSLFLAPEGQKGDVFQVKGDAISMYHDYINNIDILSTPSFNDSYIIARPTDDQAARIRFWTTHEAAPSAPNQAAVTENCQGWTIRVIHRLVMEGIVEQKWEDMAKGLQEPVR